MYAFEARTGARLWHYQLPHGTYGISSSPAVANGVVYIASTNGYTYAFSLKKNQEEAAADSKRPGLEMLHPDFNLKVSQPVATPAGAD
jgi:outer membrane protein assembly factor BamB